MDAALQAAIHRRREAADAKADVVQMTSTGLKWIDGPEDESAVTASYVRKFVDRSPSGFTGLVNQGATCYLDSVIQTLYMTPEFRSALYEWRLNAANDGDPEFSIARQLQALFARLQLSAEAAVPTGGLTKSFGWTRKDVFEQHDVQELFHVLFENLMNTTVDSPLSKNVHTMMFGAMSDYIQCQTCKTMRNRPDSFLDVSLTVEGCSSLDQSLEAFVKADVLDGPNKYNCGVCGSKQPALKGTKFTQFPYLLALQLKRFGMNWATMTRIKLNSVFSFPRFLDVSPYLSAESLADPASQQPMRYELYSVLMHAGGASSGHYFTYTQDFATGKWYRFDDNSVTELSEEEVVLMFMDPKEKAVYLQRQKERAQAETKAQAEATAKLATGTIPSPPPVAGNVPPPPPISAATVPAAPALTPGGIPQAPPAAPAIVSAVPLGSANSYALHVASQLQENSLKEHMSSQGAKGFVDPAVNAYMLMYRMVDGRNINTVPASTIPQELTDSIVAANVEFLQQKAEYERLRNMLRLRVHAEGAEYKVEISKTDPLQAVLDTAYVVAGLAEKGVSKDRVRLRDFDLSKGVPARPFVAEEMVVPAELIPLQNFKHLVMEVREADQDFEAWKVPTIPLRVMELDVNTMEYTKTVHELALPENSKVTQLRAAIAKLVEPSGNLAPEHVRLVILRGDTAETLLEDQKLAILDHQLLPDTVIQCERCSQHFTTGESLIVSKFMDKQAQITIYFNDFDPRPLDESDGTLPATQPGLSPAVSSSSECAPVFRDGVSRVAAISDAQQQPVFRSLDNVPQAPPVAATIPIPPPIAATIPPPPPIAATGIPAAPAIPGAPPVPPPIVPVAAAAPHLGVGAVSIPGAADQQDPGEPIARYNMFGLQVDGRKTLRSLKEAIAKFHGVSVDSFRIKSAQFGAELKDLDARLVSLFIRNGDSVFVQRGTPMTPGQRGFKLFLQKARANIPEELLISSNSTANASESIAPVATVTADSQEGELTLKTATPAPPVAGPVASGVPPPPPVPSPAPAAVSAVAPDAPAADPNADENFDFLGDIIVDQNWSMQQVKEHIAAQFGSLVPPATLMRIREKSGRQKVYVDNRTIRANALGDKDGKHIFIQRTHEQELLTDQHVLLFVQRWFPEVQKYGPAQELAFLRTMTIEEFKLNLALRADIPYEHIRVSKIRQYQLAQVDLIPELDWFGLKLRPESTLAGFPWAAQDGDYVLFKDNREQEIRLNKPKIVAEVAASFHPREVGIVFRTPQELAELERQRKAEAEERAKEADVIRAEMAQRARDAGLGRTPEEIAAEKARRDEMERARQDAIERALARPPTKPS